MLGEFQSDQQFVEKVILQLICVQKIRQEITVYL